MKIGVVTFPGSNCDMDMVHALSHDLGFNVVQLWHKDRDLQGVEAVVLPAVSVMETTSEAAQLRASLRSWRKSCRLPTAEAA